jgi:hypothetical protein
MIALEIKTTKSFMNSLLVSPQFEDFLVEEVTITTFNTFNIDGHIVRDFYTSEELENIEATGRSLEFSSWKDIRPICFDLIKGKKTPVSFKIVLLASNKLIEKIAANPECGVAANLIRSLALNIRYEGGKVTCITGTSFTTFVMDKSVEKLWDGYVKKLFSDFGLDFEEV